MENENELVKSVLYDVLNKLSEKKIQLLNSTKSSIFLDEIISICLPKLASLPGNIDENKRIFTISLMHYLLTNALIPSQRKITLKDIDVDVVIPNSKILLTNPENTLLLFFPKTYDVEKNNVELNKLKQIQPIKGNIWIVSDKKIKVNQKNYSFEDNSFSNIINNVRFFLKSKKQTYFKILKT